MKRYIVTAQNKPFQFERKKGERVPSIHQKDDATIHLQEFREFIPKINTSVNPKVQITKAS